MLKFNVDSVTKLLQSIYILNLKSIKTQIELILIFNLYLLTKIKISSNIIKTCFPTNIIR